MAHSTPVLEIDYLGYYGKRTKGIMGAPKSWGPQKKVVKVELYVFFEVFAFCGRRTETDYRTGHSTIFN